MRRSGGRVPAARHFLPLLLLAAALGTHAFKVGPRPTEPPGVIVRYRTAAAAAAANGAGVGIAVGGGAAATVPGTSDGQPILPRLNIWRLTVDDGTPAAVKAAQLAQHDDVLYAEPDEYVSIAVARPEPGEPPGGRVRRRLAAAAAKPGGKQPAAKRTQPAAVKRATITLPRPRPPGLMQRRALTRPRMPPPRRPPPRRPVALKPDDTMYKQQWALPRINAPKAWAKLTGNTEVLQCIVDTGVMWDHPDLVANLMPMSDEFRAANYDDNGHGTHVAGIMGAVGNNVRGISGVAWKAKILACKALDAGGWGLISKVVECIDFCRSKGARVINTSFVLTEYNLALRDAIGNGTAAGVFFAGAAGNANNNNDATNYYPGGYKFPGNVAVANTNNKDGLGTMSNWGRTTVQVAAPGTDILSTWIYPNETTGQYYEMETGTSMAAPYVSGAAAMAIAASGGRVTNAEVAAALISTSTPLPALKGKVISNGIIDLDKLVAWAIARGQEKAAAAKKAPAG